MTFQRKLKKTGVFQYKSQEEELTQLFEQINEHIKEKYKKKSNRNTLLSISKDIEKYVIIIAKKWV